MKETIAIWGQNSDNEDILIAIKLMLNKDKVQIWTFDKKEVNDEFKNSISGKWEEKFEDTFTHCKSFIERNITEENLLPDEIKTTKTDVIKIAEQEWRVRVISNKLYMQTKSQISVLNQRVEGIDVYSKTLWDECVEMSNKLKDYTLDRTLPKEYVTDLRKNLDGVFDKMKVLMESENKKFVGESNTIKESYIKKIKDITEDSLQKNTGKKGFDQLVNLQQEIKGIDILARHRAEIRKTFNTAFDSIKAKRNLGYKNKLGRRIEGLLNAIHKMEDSIGRDKRSLNFESSKLEASNVSQLEYQLRGAKLKLIEEKINSKSEKLNDMYMLLTDLKGKNEKITVQEEKVKKESGPETEKTKQESTGNKEVTKETEVSKENGTKESATDKEIISKDPVSDNIIPEEKTVSDEVVKEEPSSKEITAEKTAREPVDEDKVAEVDDAKPEENHVVEKITENIKVVPETDDPKTEAKENMEESAVELSAGLSEKITNVTQQPDDESNSSLEEE